MIDQLYIAIKRAGFDGVPFQIAGSIFSPTDARELQQEIAKLMGDSVALQFLIEKHGGKNEN